MPPGIPPVYKVRHCVMLSPPFQHNRRIRQPLSITIEVGPKCLRNGTGRIVSPCRCLRQNPYGGAPSRFQTKAAPGGSIAAGPAAVSIHARRVGGSSSCSHIGATENPSRVMLFFCASAPVKGAGAPLHVAHFIKDRAGLWCKVKGHGTAQPTALRYSIVHLGDRLVADP